MEPRGKAGILTGMLYAAGKILEVAGMLTLGIALIVYGFLEQNMNAELGFLVGGTVLFCVGRLLERRAGSRD